MQSFCEPLTHSSASWPTVLSLMLCLLGGIIEHRIQKRKTGSSKRHTWEKDLKDVFKEERHKLKKELTDNNTVYEKIGTVIGLAFVLLEWSIAGLFAIYLYVWFMAAFSSIHFVLGLSIFVGASTHWVVAKWLKKDRN